MPKEVKDPNTFIEIAKRAQECRVKESFRRIRTEEGTKRIRVLKIKARTKRYLYTIVFENFEEGIEFARKLKEVCKEIKVLDPTIQL